MKICKACNVEKEDSAFTVRRRVCKACRSEASRKARRENPEPHRKAKAKWYAANRDEDLERQRLRRLNNPEHAALYYEKNKDRLSEEHREYYAKNQPKINNRNRRRYNSDPLYKLTLLLRRRMRAALAGENKSAKAVELLGAPWAWVEVHLESLFKPGMSWENHGPVWHVDHKRPCASFDLTIPEQQRMCFHWTNLQPLFAADNLRKSDTYDPFKTV